MTHRLIGALFVCALVTSGHDVITTPITFSREISRLVIAHCASCHRPGGAAFSLLKYEEVRPWATAIKEEVLERRMPPWGAVKGFGEFRDDQGLTQEQIELIADWVEGGAPEGEPGLLPKTPEFPRRRATTPASGIAVDGALTLKSAITLAGIQPRQVSLPSGESAMITATNPDGSIEPLLWLYSYNARFQQTFLYKSPLQLAAGSRIEVTPAGGVSVTLLTKSR